MPIAAPRSGSDRKLQTRTRRSTKVTPKGDEIVDDFLKTLIAGAKFFVPVKIIGKADDETTSLKQEASGSGRKKKAETPRSEWRETLGGFSLVLAHNADKTWPTAETFFEDMNGEFWIYVSNLKDLSFVYFEIDKQPGMLFSLILI
jgi:hypothetical protein